MQSISISYCLPEAQSYAEWCQFSHTAKEGTVMISKKAQAKKQAEKARQRSMLKACAVITGAWWGIAYRGAQQKDMMPQTDIMGNPTGADYRQ